MPDRATLIPPITAIVVGLLFLVIGLARPALVWDLGKVRLGREWFGDGGLTALFVILGLVLAAVGALALARR